MWKATLINCLIKKDRNQDYYFMVSSIHKGIYQHYKGNYYEVIDVARHSETLEDMVIYRRCYGDFSLWVRPLQMFLEQIEVNGEKIHRFRFISNQPKVNNLISNKF